MSRDVWLRRACWAGSVAAVLAAGTLVQAQDILLRKDPTGEGTRKVIVIRQAAAGDAAAQADILPRLSLALS